MILKGVLVLGLLFSGENVNSLKALYSNQGYLLIGNGTKSLTEDDFLILEGKLDKNTRIDILSTGGMVQGVHHLELGEFNSYKTKNVLTLIAKMAHDKPIYLHLWSQDACETDDDIVVLAPGSILVTHSTNGKVDIKQQYIAIEQAIKKIQKEKDLLLPYQEFIENLSADAVFPEKFSIITTKGVKNFTVATKLKKVLQNPHRVLTKIIDDFSNFYMKLGYRFGLNLPKIEIDQEADYFRRAYFIHQLSIDDLDAKAALFKENDTVEQILNNKRPLLIDAMTMSDKNVVEFLLKNKINPNIAGDNGITPLLAAANKGYYDIIELLLAYGANPNIANSDGSTALNLAASQNQLDVIKLLLKHNVDPNIADSHGMVPLIIASEQSYRPIVELLLHYKANPNHANKQGITPLIIAASKNQSNIVELLLLNKADPNIADKNGITPINSASEKGYYKVVQLLLQHKADPNIADKNGITPLGIASEKGQFDIVKLLLKCRANISIKSNGLNILEIAKEKKHDQIIELLENFTIGKIRYLPADCPI